MKYIKFGLLALVSAVLASCGGGGLAPTSTSGTVSAAAANHPSMKTNLNQLVTQLSANVQNPAAGLGSIGGVTASAIAINPLEADPFDSCTTITPSTLVDEDGDDIAVNKTYKYNCNGIDIGEGRPVSKKGTVTFQDLDDSVKTDNGGGYNFVFDLDFFSPNAWTSTNKGFYKLEKSGAKLTYTSQYFSSFTETHSGQDLEGGLSSNFTYVVAGTDAANPWRKGTSSTSGFYRLIVKGDDGDGNILDWDFTFKIDSAVEYENTADSGCTQYYKSGYLTFTDASNNKLRYDYTCNSVTFSFNGTVVP